jgi:hypothetical protein
LVCDAEQERGKGEEPLPEAETIEVLVLVKAAPVMTQDLDETMCIAGVRVDGHRREWVRLHPVPFRDLADESRFTKYQVIRLQVIQHRSDRRPETWTPLYGTIQPRHSVGAQHGWAARRPYIQALGQRTMCELLELNEGGSGPGVPSLATVRPVLPLKLLITERERDQLEKWQARADAAAARPSLFDDPARPKPPFEVVPWRFSYRYRCEQRGCRGHEQTIVDWEAATLWRHVRNQQNWRDAMVAKFEQEMWQGHDSLLFVGNMEQYPNSFLVLGVFWPPSGDVQGVLDV